jgi:hypothetical protein
MIQSALAPVFVQVALTFALLGWMGAWRVWLLQSRQVKYSAIALGQPGYSEGCTKVARSFHNQLETPMLFFAAVGFAAVAAKISSGFVTVEWIFVAFRLLHAGVHVTSNFVPLRFLMFCCATTALIVLWVMLGVATLG